MCTVTYLPDTDLAFTLTHNRDEHFTRGVAFPPSKHSIANEQVIFPVDIDAGGTWVAAGQHYVLCLLNGGFVRHERQLPYRHSRGKVIPDFFLFKDVRHFLSEYNFSNLEPFTLIIVDDILTLLHEIVFDGSKVHHTLSARNQAHIWSSTTLYTVSQIAARRQFFERFLAAGNFTQEQLISFHKNKFDEYIGEGIFINRNNVLKTVSLTSILKSNSLSFYYEDFIHGQVSNTTLQ